MFSRRKVWGDLSLSVTRSPHRVLATVRHVQEEQPSRLRIAAGVLKALFTTSPLKTAIVEIKRDGEIVIKTADAPRDR